MDGGCGAQRPICRASTSVVLLPATVSVAAATDAAPIARCSRRRATARGRYRLRLRPPPPLIARRCQRGVGAVHIWLRTAGAPLPPRNADRTAPVHPAGGPPPPQRRPPQQPAPAKPYRRTTRAATRAAQAGSGLGAAGWPLRSPPSLRVSPPHEESAPASRHACQRTDRKSATTPLTCPHPRTPAPAPPARPPRHPTLPRTAPLRSPHPALPGTPPRQPPLQRHARHYTQYLRATHHTSPRLARMRTTAPYNPLHPTTPAAAPSTPPHRTTPDATPTARPPPRARHARRATLRYPPPLTAPVRPPPRTRCQPARAGHGGLAIAIARRPPRHRPPTSKVPIP